MTLEERILEALVRRPRLTRRALLCMDRNTKGMYRALQKMSDAGLVSVKKASGVADSVVSVTADGILRLGAGGNVPWLEKVGAGSLAALSLYDASADGSRGRRGYIERNDADLLCLLSGMDTLLLPQYSGGGNGIPGTAADSKSRQAVSPGHSLIHTRLGSACPSFLREELLSPAREVSGEGGSVKARFITKPSASPLLGMAGPDFRSSRFSGLAIGSTRSLLVYNPLRRDFTVSVQDEDRDMLVWRRLAYTLPHSGLSPVPDGAVFVNDASAFASLCLRDGFGEGFGHLHAVPRTFDGTSFLRWLMSGSEESIRDAVVPCFGASRFGPDSPLPAETDGIPCCIGCSLDMRLLQQARALLSVGSISRIGVICFPWQWEYCRSVLPEAERFLIEQDA